MAVNSIPRGDIGKPKISELGEILQSHLSNEQSIESTGDRLQDVIDIASRVFRLASDELSAESTPDSVPAWDSYTHLNLIIEIERHFSCRIKTATIATVRSLADLARVVS